MGSNSAVGAFDISHFPKDFLRTTISFLYIPVPDLIRRNDQDQVTLQRLESRCRVTSIRSSLATEDIEDVMHYLETAV